VRRRADIENKTARHPDADVTREINKAIRAWHEYRNNANQKSGWTLTSLGTTTANTQGSDLTNATLRIDALFMSDGTLGVSDMWQLTEISNREIAEYWTGTQRGRPEKFYLPTEFNVFTPTARIVQWFPIPDKAYNYYAAFLPTLADLSGGTDAIIVPMADGIEWIVLEAAKKFAIKDDDGDRYQLLVADQAAVTQRMLDGASRQQAASPIRRRDTRGLRKMSEQRARNRLWWPD
jgi:hypothetical protein